MALRFLDSFDHYSTGDILKKWTINTSAFTINTSLGRFGGSCLRSSSDFSNNGVVTVLNPQPTWIVGFAFSPGTVGIAAGISNFVQLISSGVFQVGVTINVDTTLSIVTGGNSGNSQTVLATSTTGIRPNTYSFIEFKATLNTSIAAHTCQLKLNGNLVAEASAAANTDRAASGSANAIGFLFPWFIPGNGGPIAFDDVYICDGTGSSNNNFLGDVKIVSLFPTGNGAFSQFVNDASNSTNNFSHVNANPTNNGTTFVKSSTPGNEDTYAFGSLAFSGIVHGIQQVLELEKDNAGSVLVAPVIRIAGTDYTGFNISPTSSYLFYMSQNDVKPSNFTAWTTADVNGSQYGVVIKPLTYNAADSMTSTSTMVATAM